MFKDNIHMQQQYFYSSEPLIRN